MKLLISLAAEQKKHLQTRIKLVNSDFVYYVIFYICTKPLSSLKPPSYHFCNLSSGLFKLLFNVCILTVQS